MALRFDFLIAKLQRTTVKPTQSKAALATVPSAGASAANRNSLVGPAASLVGCDTTALKRRNAG